MDPMKEKVVNTKIDQAPLDRGEIKISPCLSSVKPTYIKPFHAKQKFFEMMSSVEQLEKEFLEDRLDANKIKRQQYEAMQKRKEKIKREEEEGKKWVPWLKHREDEQNFGSISSPGMKMQRLKPIRDKIPNSGRNSKGSLGRSPRN